MTELILGFLSFLLEVLKIIVLVLFFAIKAFIVVFIFGFVVTVVSWLVVAITAVLFSLITGN